MSIEGEEKSRCPDLKEICKAAKEVKMMVVLCEGVKGMEECSARLKELLVGKYFIIHAHQLLFYGQELGQVGGKYGSCSSIESSPEPYLAFVEDARCFCQEDVEKLLNGIGQIDPDKKNIWILGVPTWKTWKGRTLRDWAKENQIPTFDLVVSSPG